ncbi:MAG TPA: PmoA family protein [Algoriphagus sp.]|nr:PmoA family protein [Algoriphagus sp.]
MFSLLKTGILTGLILISNSESPEVKNSTKAEPPKKANSVTLVRKDAEKKVEVLVNGELFTAYIYPETIDKPVLYPIKSAKGNDITRGYPLAPRPGERVDHPHHVGLWFNYGDVNGLDFWNNSDAIPAEKKDAYGSIVHTGILKSKDGKDKAELEVGMDWVNSKGEVLLKEKTTFVFSVEGNKRVIDRITTLTAQSKEVAMTDNKEGMLGIRVARQLEHPSDKPEIFTDASGIATAVPTLNNSGVNGLYRSAAGKEGDAVWGTRANWVDLSGEINGEKIDLAIIDHPANPGFPTYWHARGYGLFAANTLGQKSLSGGKEELNFKIAPGKSATFRYRIIVDSDGDESDEKLNQEFESFSKVK